MIKDYLQPKVPDLDDIVPLPPAPLPEWDGKIAFQRWFEGEAPPKPDEALGAPLGMAGRVKRRYGLRRKNWHAEETDKITEKSTALLRLNGLKVRWFFSVFLSSLFSIFVLLFFGVTHGRTSF